ncbi:MAG TPA: MGMT family protein [Ignavibacteriaceae bacterium]|nr:MAG: Methylated-DNA--protein-cysteine methyltransferase [Ignavibacteria bacterium ADurb.Bin266]OQY72531.1 MAG: 6-O-methylguanine DNA methyltransferase [Ignavibacteriales bacterium UTCHB2]HQF42400.1 MGMT family protein [Ignavibacteriaceae bacterium]HQI41873.1 MGMT family protein [Ignavibacteriaceae bacterium]
MKKKKRTAQKKDKTRKDFFNKVYKITKKIPYGKVTTFGDIAETCGIRSAARTVGWALNGCGPDIPAHRVVNRYGALTGKFHFGDPNLMEELLRSEGIEFDEKGCVILEKYLWKPKKNAVSKK